MKILHSSDWHLGKTLEGNSRIDEQKEFFIELNEICDREKIDMILVPGDIYDSFSPSSVAQRLFYDEIKKLSKNGERPIIIISGNHDSPERLTAANSYLIENGVFVFGNFADTIECISYKKFKILKSEKGYIEAEFKGEILSIALLPYPSEKRLNEILYSKSSNDDMQRDYSAKIGDILKGLSANFREETVNIIMSHLYAVGGEGTDSERKIQLGGSLALNLSDIPEADYIALGHLHRAQEFKSKKMYYSGSPIQYSKSEILYPKSVYIYDTKEKETKREYLKNYKAIEVWRSKNIEEAINMCRENSERDIWVYLEIETDEIIKNEEIKEMKKLKKDILEIKAIFKDSEIDDEEYENEEDVQELFEKYYYEEREVKASSEIMDLFLSLVELEESGE